MTPCRPSFINLRHKLNIFSCISSALEESTPRKRVVYLLITLAHLIVDAETPFCLAPRHGDNISRLVYTAHALALVGTRVKGLGSARSHDGMSVRVNGVVLHSRSSCQLFRFLLLLFDFTQVRSWDSGTYRGIIACLVVSRVVAIRLRDELVLAMRGSIVIDDVTYTINGVQKSIEQARILHLIQMVVLIVNLIDGNVLWVYDGISHLCI